MPSTWDEAVAALTGPGAPFESVEAEVHGQRLRIFKNTPASLRTLFDAARARGDATFLVYEDERWSFAETMRQVDALGAALVSRSACGPATASRSRCATTRSGWWPSRRSPRSARSRSR